MAIREVTTHTIYPTETPGYTLEDKLENGWKIAGRGIYSSPKFGDLTRFDLVRTTFVGAVLTRRERNFYHDSDFYAVVWDAEKGQIRSVEYATTRFATYGNYAKIDATDEAKDAAAAYLADVFFEAWKKQNVADARVPSKGKAVRITKKKSDGFGEVGVVTWYGKGKKFYHNHIPDMRVRVISDNFEGFLNASDVEVVNPEQYESTDEEIRDAAAARAAHIREANSGWHVTVAGGPGMVVV